jgi:hypothetical protein
MEFAHAKELANNIIRARRNKASSDRELGVLAEFDTILDSVMSASVFVASFSEVFDSLSQWRAYGAQPTAYSVGFDADILTACATPQGFHLHRCVYERSEQDAVLSELVHRMVDTELAAEPRPPRAEGERLACTDRFAWEFVQLGPTMKDPSFKEEREWRLIGLIGSETGRWRMRVGVSTLIPYVAVEWHEAEASPIRELTIGPSPHRSEAMDGASILMRLNEVVPCTFRQSAVPYRSW